MRSLIESGDSPDLSSEQGIWDSPLDRDNWRKYVACAKTLGAVALALYLLGDRAIHFVSILTKDARFANEEWDDHCYISGEGGNLVCCEACPRTVLPASLGLARAPKGDFFCAYCVRDQNRRARRGESNPSSSNDRSQRSTAATNSNPSRAKKADSKSSLRAADVIEKMRRNISKHGIIDGSICEIETDPRVGKREERCFVKVLDGNLDKSSDEPAIKSCQYFTEWRPRENKMIVLCRKKGPILVKTILQVGSITEVLVGDHRTGFAPASSI
jgi:hypothetical protein